MVAFWQIKGQWLCLMAYGYHLPGLLVSIRNQQFVYHLTSIENVPSILRNGLLPRSHLEGRFADVADPQIIEGRREMALEQFVPFHWFAKNPLMAECIRTDRKRFLC